MKLNNYYKELPNNFKEVYVIDAKKKKTSILFTVFSFVIMAIVIVITYFITKLFKVLEYEYNYTEFLIADGIFILGSIAYIILHELTHGVVYYIMTKQKLTFGLTLTVAFCGVPHIYVNKKTALLAILAPFVVYTIVFITLIALVQTTIYVFVLMLLFSIHFGGCVGDLYGTYIMLFKIKEPCLMNDTGPKQTFYIENKEPVE